MTTTLADLVDAVVEGPLPVRFSAYDGSKTGPDDAPRSVHLASERGAAYLVTAPGDLGLARAYVSDDLELHGVHPGNPYDILVDLEQVHFRRPSPAVLADVIRTLGIRGLTPPPPPTVEALPRWRRMAEGLRHSKTRDATAIHHHYDVSNRFYEYILGPTMAYTCACFPTESATLEQAQENKHRLVFDKIRLQPGERLLDIGCGWGGMVRYAARRGVKALGVTLSEKQAEWAQRTIRDEGLTDLAEVRFQDYRDVPETEFDAISSIGVTEHIGVRNYPGYFRWMLDRLRPGGLLLNHCITRPVNTKVKVGPFIDRYIFPDGELTGSGRIVTEIQNAGFEVLHEENLREHYARTLHQWCRNLEENWDACVAEVGEATAKVWGLYLAGSRRGFETDVVQLHQVLAVKQYPDHSTGLPLRPWWQP